MPKIQRETQKIFCNSADSDQIAVFGSMATGTPVYSNNIEELQNNEAFDLGWDAATLEDKAPFMEEMNGLQYAITKQLAYNFQEGVPEYDAGTTYYIGSICKVLEDGKPVLYTSLTDDNIGNNPVNDSTNWERLSFGGGGLEIGDVGFTQMAIDESKGKRRILNGQLIIQEQYVQFTNIVKATQALNPELFCTEAEWQTELTMSANGVCYKYVIDDEAGTIRLPKYPDYLDLSIKNATVSVYGTGKTLGMTNGSVNTGLNGGTAQNNGQLFNAAAYGSNVTTTAPTTEGTYTGVFGVVTDASKSGLTGKVTNPSEKIKGTYFIQVATGAETEDNIINEIELNNPFSLLDYKYSEYELNNISWLRSEGQYNSKAIYPAVYDLLLKIYNGTETKDGVSVKLVTEEYSNTDFVLNTDEETFRLSLVVKAPLMTQGRRLVAKKEPTASDSTWYNLYSDGWLEQGGLYSSPTNTWETITFLKSFRDTNYNVACTAQSANASMADTFVGWKDNTKTESSIQIGPRYISSSGAVEISWCVCGYANVPTQDEYTEPITYDYSGLKLYFYVGETVQNANLVNIGRIQEQYTTKSMVDGQVEVVNKTLASNVSLTNTTHTYDLTDYIPNDGYLYEIQVGVTGQTAVTAGSSIEIRMGTDISPLGCGFVGANRTVTANTQMNLAGNINLIIGAERKLYVQNSSASAAFSLIFLRLGTRRRLGTNL